VKVRPDCDFFSEFDDEEEDEEESTRKKKRFRYRWPDEIRDDALARLLALNQQRYEADVLAGLHDNANGSRSSRKRTAGEDEEWDEDQSRGDCFGGRILPQAARAREGLPQGCPAWHEPPEAVRGRPLNSSPLGHHPELNPTLGWSDA
jgi:hypothetical protein